MMNGIQSNVNKADRQSRHKEENIVQLVDLKNSLTLEQAWQRHRY